MWHQLLRRGNRRNRPNETDQKRKACRSHDGPIFRWIDGWATDRSNFATPYSVGRDGRYTHPALLSLKAEEDNIMADSIETRLRAVGVTLPEAAAPAANYVPYVVHGRLLQTSGQLPIDAGKLAVTGKLGASVSLENGQVAARLCAINILAQAKAALDGDWRRVNRLLKLTVFVASDASFTEQHKVANGASDFLVDILGDKGRHSRSAVGVPALPLDAAVEIEALFEID